MELHSSASSSGKNIFWNFISYNLFKQCSNKTSNLWHCMWNLPVLRFSTFQYLTLFSQIIYVCVYMYVFMYVCISDCLEGWALDQETLILNRSLPCLLLESEIDISPLCISAFIEKPQKITRLLQWIDRKLFFAKCFFYKWNWLKGNSSSWCRLACVANLYKNFILCILWKKWTYNFTNLNEMKEHRDPRRTLLNPVHQHFMSSW